MNLMNVPKLVLTYLLIVLGLLLIDNQLKHKCTDFWTKTGAQERFESDMVKYQNLDRDHDLKACE